MQSAIWWVRSSSKTCGTSHESCRNSSVNRTSSGSVAMNRSSSPLVASAIVGAAALLPRLRLEWAVYLALVFGLALGGAFF